MDSKLAEELRLLLDAAAERAQPWLHRIAAAEGPHDAGTCGWCPLCNAVALARGDRSELAAKAAEHVAGLIAVLRAALSEPAQAADVPDEEPVRPEKPRVQHIPVVRRAEGRPAEGSPADWPRSDGARAETRPEESLADGARVAGGAGEAGGFAARVAGGSADSACETRAEGSRDLGTQC